MVDWIVQVFASPSDKAKLITILLSTVIGISLFFMTQLYNRRTARRVLIIEKVEEMYSCFLDFEEHAFDAITLSLGTDNESELGAKKSLGEAISALKKVQLFAKLYFKDIKFERETFYLLVCNAMTVVHTAAKNDDDNMGRELIAEGFDSIREQSEMFENSCKTYMKKFRH